MASSMIHLAIIQCIIVKTEFNNLDRLRLGVILPDGAVSGNSHLKKMICEQTRVTYDLEFYRETEQLELPFDLPDREKG